MLIEERAILPLERVCAFGHITVISATTRIVLLTALAKVIAISTQAPVLATLDFQAMTVAYKRALHTIATDMERALTRNRPACVMQASGALSVSSEVVQRFKSLHVLGMATVNLGVGSVSVMICTVELTVA